MKTASDTSIFKKAVNHVLHMEGGYVNHPSDPGGETAFGISKRAHPDVDIKNLTASDAVSIYFRHYWLHYGVATLPPKIAFFMLDSVVNQGEIAIKQLQNLVGTTPDGDLGPITLAAVYQQNADTLIIQLLSSRARRYVRLGIHKRSLAPFVDGWLNRLFKLHAAILREFPS